jgi:hypothetical protein
MAVTTRAGIAQFTFPDTTNAVLIVNPTICAKGVFGDFIF